MNLNDPTRLLPLRLRSNIPLPGRIAVHAPVKRSLPGLPHFLLPLLLLATLNPLLSTALADGGAAAIVPVLLTTFTNPTPAVADNFGIAIAALGSNYVLIGAPRDDTGPGNAGALYLFHLNGGLVRTFIDPTPYADEHFGSSVAVLGSDREVDARVLIGAPSAVDDNLGGRTGQAHLFNFYGDLLTTYRYFAGSNGFGSSLAAVGNNRVVIGAPFDSDGTPNDGHAYLFSVYPFPDPIPVAETIFHGPLPGSFKNFGISVAAMGDLVLIGAPGDNVATGGTGGAFLFSPNPDTWYFGTLVAAFYSPVYATNDSFGYRVLPVGSDRVLVGAPYATSPGGARAGAAYLFSTNRMLLTTFTNPTPGTDDRFGCSLAVLGSDRVVIGANQDDTAAINAGAAYLFSTNGALLATLTQPAPTAEARFGTSVAVIGSDRVIIGAVLDSTGGSFAGAAYLFALVPSLDVRRTPTNTLAVSWPLFSPDYALQQNSNGLATANWSTVTDTIQNDGTNNYITVDPGTGDRFYRLIKP